MATQPPEAPGEAAAGDELAAALAALSYAIAGWPVFPLDGKVPRTSHGLLDASTDPATVAGWWEQWPAADIGLVTGQPSGLLVLDVDVQHGGGRTLAELERKHGKLERTAEVLTGGGGRHLYHQHLGRGVRNSAGRFGHGVDVRGDGGYVVAPPSIHASGRPYKWVREIGTATLLVAPAWLLEDAQQRRNGSAPEVAAVIPAGQRNTELTSLAGTMRRRGMSAGEITAALLAVNADRCQPPLGEDELERIATSVGRYPPATPKVLIAPPIDHKSGVNEKESGGELPFSPLAPLLEQVPPEPPWLLRGFLAPFAITLLAGRPKVGKSTLACAVLAKVAAGERFVGLETACAGVLLLSEERRDTLAEKARILELISFRHAPSPIGGAIKTPAVHALMRHDAGAVPWPEVVRQAMAYCKHHELTILVVDTFDRWTGLRGDAENAAGAVNEALEPLQYAAAAGLAILLVTHQRKGGGEFGEAVRGSTALTGGVDIVVELERPPRTLQLGSDARVLRTVSRFASTPEELHVKLDEHGFVPIDSPEQVKTDAEREKVLAVLEAAGEPTAADIVAAELELPTSTVRRHLNTLRDRGLVARSGQGKRGDAYLWNPSGDEEQAA